MNKYACVSSIQAYILGNNKTSLSISCHVPDAGFFFAHLSKDMDLRVQGSSVRKYLIILSLISLAMIPEKSDMTRFPKQASDKEGTNNFILKVCFICPAVQMWAIRCCYK